MKNCPYCGEQILDVAKKCKHCGEWVDGSQHSTLAVDNNNLPEDYKRFNWGAFWLSWIWGIFNKTYITFLAIPAIIINLFVPFASIGLNIWFGVKGNEWAWKNKKWHDLDSFNNTQRKWAIGGTIYAIVFFFLCLFLIAIFFMAFFNVMTHSKVIETTFNTSEDCKKYREYKENKNEHFSAGDIIKYRDYKNGCGYDLLINTVGEMIKD